MKKTITLTVNNVPRSYTIHPGDTLLNVLRGHGHYGPKSGCNQGSCGACAVLLDGRLVNACMVTASQVEGARIETVEGLANGTDVHPIQKAFVDAGAVQCGYCTPGMIMATKDLLEKTPNPSDDDIRAHLDGNLCRCTGYVKIIDGVKRAATLMKEASPATRRSKAGKKE